jgi:protein TonB
MVTQTGASGESDPHEQRANDRFKSSLNRWFLGSIMLATALHFGVLAFFPELTAADLGPHAPPDSMIVVPPPYDIPRPPEPIERPAVPVVSPVPVDDELTIPRTTPEANPVPPPLPEVTPAKEGPFWVPRTVEPEIKDRGRAMEIVLRHYPKILQDAGIGGRVSVWVFIDTSGRVRDARVQMTSGVAALDEAALSAVYEFEFSPALNMDETVAVWASFNIAFEIPR